MGSGNPAFLGARGSATRAMQRLTAYGQWALQLREYIASLRGAGEQCNSRNTLPHCPGTLGSATLTIQCTHCKGAVGNGTRAIHCETAWGQWAVGLLQDTTSRIRGSGQCNSCNALPHCLWGSGRCNSCYALPHFLEAVGSATPAIHCHTAGGQWAVQLLQYRSRRRSACRGPTYGEPWRRPSGAPRRHCRGSPPSYLR